MSSIFNQLLEKLKIHPVLIDVGASGGQYPTVWKSISKQSVYVGFDPDSRELYDLPAGTFFKGTVVNEAVTSQSTSEPIPIYLTRSPYCSSTLPPDNKALEDYVFSNLFEVVDQTQVSATTLAEVCKRLGMERIDWLKVDSQGTDLRLFASLPDDLRATVLAVDVEPGLIDAYQGEDLFIEVQRELYKQGFWLSNLVVNGTVRIRRESLAQVMGRQDIEYGEAGDHLKNSPGWCEARYLRTIEHLITHQAAPREYIVLWGFALLDNQLGFALDVSLAYQRQYPNDVDAKTLVDESTRLVRAAFQKAPMRIHVEGEPLIARIKRSIPRPIKSQIKKLLGRS